MKFNYFHFENPFWLWGVLVIPIIWGLYKLLYRHGKAFQCLGTFIDAALLPHLLVAKEKGQRSLWKSLSLWSVLWILLMGALAGPRWNYRDIETFMPDQSLIILLDVSKSMDTEDIKPSRLGRARQKIEDILHLAQGVKIGLIAFAADPHMISPLTDDKETICHFLPSLTTDMVFVQGSKLLPALTMASHVLEAGQGNNKSILIISDGGFEDKSAIAMAHELAQKGIAIHTMGMGTEDGGPIRDSSGNFIKKQGNMVISKLETDKLRELSQVGKGLYLQAHYVDDDILALLNQIKARAKAEENVRHKIRHWKEHFYLLIFPLMVVLLFWFRRGFVFPILLFSLGLSIQQAHALELQNYFKNSQQIGKEAFERGEYDIATQKFTDPYRQGVAQYKAGNFAEAENLFRQSARPEIANEAAYNLGNALAKQRKLEEAVAAYEKVLEKNPNNTKAKHNLEIVKKLLEKEKQEKEDQQKDSQHNKDNDKENQGDQNKNDSTSKAQQESKAQKKENNNKTSEDNPDKQPDKKGAESQEKSEQQRKEKNKGSSENIPEKQSDKTEAQPSQQEKEQKAGEEEQDTKEPPKEDISERDIPQSQDEQKGSVKRKREKTQQDRDADEWLNRINNDPKSFLKNQFYIESRRNKTNEGVDPW